MAREGIFFLECSFLKSEILNCRLVKLRKRDCFAKVFSESVKVLEHLFLSDYFRKMICSGIFNPIENCKMKSYSFIKMELYYIHFSGCFPKFSVHQFQNTLMRAFVMSLEEFWVVDYSLVFIKM